MIDVDEKAIECISPEVMWYFDDNTVQEGSPTL